MSGIAMKNREHLDKIREHMEVVGSDGRHVGTVDHADAEMIKLTKRDDPDGSGQHHHYLSMSYVTAIEGNRVKLAIRASEADELADLGTLMQDLLAENPAEMFLIEGHTDAVGRAAMNLALSDRRAESVALALSEYFDIPPENMVIQGYGEAELLIDTEANERRNRRVAVRVITPLLHASAN